MGVKELSCKKYLSDDHSRRWKVRIKGMLATSLNRSLIPGSLASNRAMYSSCNFLSEWTAMQSSWSSQRPILLTLHVISKFNIRTRQGNTYSALLSKLWTGTKVSQPDMSTNIKKKIIRLEIPEKQELKSIIKNCKGKLECN